MNHRVAFGDPPPRLHPFRVAVRCLRMGFYKDPKIRKLATDLLEESSPIMGAALRTRIPRRRKKHCRECRPPRNMIMKHRIHWDESSDPGAEPGSQATALKVAPYPLTRKTCKVTAFYRAADPLFVCEAMPSPNDCRFWQASTETLSHERKTVRELAAGKRLCDPQSSVNSAENCCEALRKPAREWRDETRGPHKTLRDPHHR